MGCFVGLDAGKRFTSICVLDAKGAVLREGKVETSPKAVVAFLRGQRRRYSLIGIEAWSLATWLCEGLCRARLPAICIESRHAHGVLKAQPNKTDRSDARGIADLMRTGTYRAVHLKSQSSQETMATLTARRVLRTKMRDLDNAISGLLLGFGLKLTRRKGSFDDDVSRLMTRHAAAQDVVAPLLAIRRALDVQAEAFERRLESLALADPTCQLLMTAPGVGPMTALLFKVTIDDPGRFRRSRALGPHLGLVPRTIQSGAMERRSGITKHGSRELRTALYMAALTSLKSNTRPSWLKDWARAVADRRGGQKAAVAVARRLAVLLHRMWITNKPFQWEARIEEPVMSDPVEDGGRLYVCRSQPASNLRVARAGDPGDDLSGASLTHGRPADEVDA